MGRINEVIRLDRENGAASKGAGPALQKGDSGRPAKPLATITLGHHHPAGRQPGV